MKKILRHKLHITVNLKQFLQKKSKELVPLDLPNANSIMRLETSAISGKMIRGSLLLFAHEMFGGKYLQAALQSAAALEIMQTALLIHDDIMDQDEMRRGQISVHTQYKLWAQEKNIASSERFGENIGICMGDIAFFLSFELLGNLAVPEEIKTQVLSTYSQELSRVGFGQIRDVYHSMATDEPTAQDILKVYESKTARYTFVLPLVLGAYLAEQSPQVINELTQLGIHIGLLFQLVDDRLSIFGTEKETGKPAGTDISRNNKTLYRYYLLRKSTPVLKKKLQNIFGKPVTMQDIDDVKNLIPELKIDQIIDSKLAELEEKSITLIQKLTISAENKDALVSLVNFCKTRLV